MAFEFFRKYQRPILLTAGIFALITFSISVPLYGFIDYLTASPYRGPELTLADGRKVTLTAEDDNIGLRIATGSLSGIVTMPTLESGEEQGSLRTRYAALRRLAIEAGIGVSEADIDATIQEFLKVLDQPDLTPANLVGRGGASSVSELRMLVGEAIRIGTYLRLFTLAGDISDAALVASLLKDRELLTLKVAVVDETEIETALKATPVTDEQLKTWLDSRTDEQKNAYRHPNSRVALTAAGLLLPQFDIAKFTAETKDRTFSDDELRQRYDLDRERLYRKAKPTTGGEPKSGDEGQPPKESTEPKKDGGGDLQGEQDPTTPTTPTTPQTGDADATKAATQEPEYVPFEEVKEQIRKTLGAEETMKVLWGKVQEAMAKHLAPAIETRNKAYEEHATAATALADAEAKLTAGPKTPELEAAVTTAKSDVDAKDAAKKAADDALNAARKAFPMGDVFLDLVKDRAEAARVHVVAEPRPPEGLKDLGELGSWDRSWAASLIDTPGDLSTQVQTTDKAVFFFQVTAIEPRPMKDFAEIKEQLTIDWYKHQSDEKATEKMKAFQDALLRLAKASRAEAIAKIEGVKAEKLTKQLDDWRAGLQKSLDEATRQREQLQQRDPGGRDFRRWEAHEKSLREELAKETEKRAEFEKVIDDQIARDVATEARKAYGEVFDAAAAEAGVTVRQIGPHLRDLSAQPRFADRYSAAERFLFTTGWGSDAEYKQVRSMKVGEVSDVLDDATNRVQYLVLATAVEKADVASLTRRDLMTARDGFRKSRLQTVFQQSFSTEALEKRHGLRTSTVDIAEPERAKTN